MKFSSPLAEGTKTMLGHVAIGAMSAIVVLCADPMAMHAAHASGSIDRLEGLYGGAVVGASYITARVKRGGGDGSRTFSDESATGGLFLGYNAQLGTGNWLLGVEADITFADHDKTQSDDILDNVRLRQKWAGTIRGRGGYVRDNALIYGTVGLAISDLEIEPLNLGPHDAIRAGIVLGLGSDLVVGDHWLVRVEGLATFYPDEEVGFAGSDRTVEYRQATIRFGIARKF